MELTISLGNKRTDKIWTQTSYSLEQFEARISTTIRTAETVAEYKKLAKSKQDNINLFHPALQSHRLHGDKNH